MKYRTVLGPCPCSTCGVLVVWDGWRWLTLGGFKHRACAASVAAARKSNRRTARYLTYVGETIG